VSRIENHPLISVIIPCFNYAHLIGETIKSVIDQTYKNWECIIIDDGSTDNTKNVIEEISSIEPRVKYIYQNNSGPTIARNLGLKSAKGNYIQFLDADDILELSKFESQLKKFEEHKNCHVVYGNTSYFKHPDQTILYSNLELESLSDSPKSKSGSGKEFIIEMIKNNLMVISSPLFKKELVEQFGMMDEKLFFNEDWELWLKFAVKNAKFEFNEDKNAGVKIRVHQSYSKDNFKMFVNGLYVCLKYKKELSEPCYQKILEPKINYHTKIIDAKILTTLKKDKIEAVKMIDYANDFSQLPRYRFYKKYAQHMPYFLTKGIAFSIAAVVKLKSVIKNGA
jgi:glycosyltransferase involved in cell wall biosynthesis